MQLLLLDSGQVPVHLLFDLRPLLVGEQARSRVKGFAGIAFE
jgi:hypothetical protein